MSPQEASISMPVVPQSQGASHPADMRHSAAPCSFPTHSAEKGCEQPRRLVRRKGTCTGWPLTPVAMLPATGSQGWLEQGQHAPQRQYPRTSSGHHGKSQNPEGDIRVSQALLDVQCSGRNGSTACYPSTQGETGGSGAQGYPQLYNKMWGSKGGSRLGVPTRPRPCHRVWLWLHSQA